MRDLWLKLLAQLPRRGLDESGAVPPPAGSHASAPADARRVRLDMSQRPDRVGLDGLGISVRDVRDSSSLERRGPPKAGGLAQSIPCRLHGQVAPCDEHVQEQGLPGHYQGLPIRRACIRPMSMMRCMVTATTFMSGLLTRSSRATCYNRPMVPRAWSAVCSQMGVLRGKGDHPEVVMPLSMIFKDEQREEFRPTEHKEWTDILRPGAMNAHMKQQPYISRRMWPAGESCPPGWPGGGQPRRAVLAKDCEDPLVFAWRS